MTTWFLWFLNFSFFFSAATAVLANFSFDDTHGKDPSGELPIYIPPLLWTSTCLNCSPSPEAYLAYEKTWTDMVIGPVDTVEPTVTLNFSGVAIYVFFILSNFQDTACDFYIDGALAGSFRKRITTPKNGTYIYNSLVFSAQNLSLETAHNLTFITVPWPRDNYIAFDYALFTNEDKSATTSGDSPTSKTSTSTSTNTSVPPLGPSQSSIKPGQIAGAVIGTVLACAIIAFLFFLFWRRRAQKRAAKEALMPSSYLLQNTMPIGQTSHERHESQVDLLPASGAQYPTQRREKAGFLHPTTWSPVFLAPMNPKHQPASGLSAVTNSPNPALGTVDPMGSAASHNSELAPFLFQSPAQIRELRLRLGILERALDGEGVVSGPSGGGSSYAHASSENLARQVEEQQAQIRELQDRLDVEVGNEPPPRYDLRSL